MSIKQLKQKKGEAQRSTAKIGDEGQWFWPGDRKLIGSERSLRTGSGEDKSEIRETEESSPILAVEAGGL